jgi:hypothetical protein
MMHTSFSPQRTPRGRARARDTLRQDRCPAASRTLRRLAARVYARRMQTNLGPPADEEPERSVEEPAPPAREERFGPLQLHRLRKDDGRLLILYTRLDEPD